MYELKEVIGIAIVAFFMGAACLEIFWYERRRRKHRREDIEMAKVWDDHLKNETDYCPFSDEYDEEMNLRNGRPDK